MVLYKRQSSSLCGTIVLVLPIVCTQWLNFALGSEQTDPPVRQCVTCSLSNPPSPSTTNTVINTDKWWKSSALSSNMHTHTVWNVLETIRFLTSHSSTGKWKHKVHKGLSLELCSLYNHWWDQEVEGWARVCLSFRARPVLSWGMEVWLLSLPWHEHLLDTKSPLCLRPSLWVTMATPIHTIARDWLQGLPETIIRKVHCFVFCRGLYFFIDRHVNWCFKEGIDM